MDFASLKKSYDMRISGVLHLGAHLGEEAQTYAENGVGAVWWVEANPAVIPNLKRHFVSYGGQKIIEACVYSQDGVELTFNVTNLDGMSSSILEFGTHTNFSPDIFFERKIKVITSTVDSLVAKHKIEANFLNMDLQGAELHALMGASEFLTGVDYVMTEVNKDEVYKGCAHIEQLDEVLRDFKRVQTHWVPGQGWGDAIYVRKVLL